ncbi:unnamed protein product, partial [Brenthis ino]
MKLSVIAVVLCACIYAATADVAHIKATKAKLLGRLAGKHHKRGILSSVPPFKLGHDIPLVTHSVVKPLVVTYPPTAAVAAVKIPVPNPHVPRFPAPVGHRVHGLPHPHYGLKFPHTKFVAQSDHHFHHHHHHVAPRPIVPVVPAAPLPPTPVTHVAPVRPVLPIPQPTVAVTHSAPAPPPPVILPASVLPAHPLPVPAPPVPIVPNHLHLKPLLPAGTIPLAPAPTPLFPAPVFPLRQPYPYVIRPGGAVQTSVFATYPRYPLINSYQAPLFPFQTPSTQAFPQILLERPHVHAYQGVAQAVDHHGVIEQHSPNFVVEETPHLHPTQVAPQPAFHVHPAQEQQPTFHVHPTQETLTPQPAFHLHPTQETLLQPGLHLHPTQETHPEFHLHPAQELLPQPGFHLHPTQDTLQHPGFHLHPTQENIPQPGYHLQHSQGVPQPTQPSLEHDGWNPVASQPHDLASHEGHFPQQSHHFSQEQGTQVFEHHTDDQYNDYQHQLQHHIQQQIEQAQYEQSLNNQHQPAQEYGVPQHGQDFGQNDYSQQGQDFGNNGQDFVQHGQDYSQHGQDFSQHGQDFSQHGHDFSQQGQNFGQQGQDFGQHDYNLGHPGQEYGLPQQGIEGRNADENEQQFHNHIPLGLQPPLDRPLDHFQ